LVFILSDLVKVCTRAASRRLFCNPEHQETGRSVRRFLVDVVHDGERWTSKARRRMITVLENEWDEVVRADGTERTH
jgi:hypothetical protein